MTNSSEETRIELLKAALKLFALHGFDGTTVKQIADEANVNISLISYHFQGKENLYWNCIEHFSKERMKISDSILKIPKTHEEFLLRLKIFVEEFYKESINTEDLFKVLMVEFHNNNNKSMELFKNTFNKILENLTTYLKEAQKHKLIRKDINPHTAAWMFIGSIIQMYKMSRFMHKFSGLSFQDEKQKDKILNDMFNVFCNGISTEQNKEVINEKH